MAGYLNLPTDAERNYQKRIVDSKGQAGPTLQRIADRAKVYKNNTGMLEALFDAIAPISMYSGNAEGAHIPSKAMLNAQGLAKVFQDWYKTGTPTINVPFDKWSDIIKSGKFKNQMELAGKNHPEAWDKRVEVEKKLGGFPYPKTTRIERPNKDEILKKLQEDHSDLLNYPQFLDYYFNTEKKHIPEYSESLAKQNPVYGHIYNPKYTHKGTATRFGNTHAEMSDLVKEQSKYVLGDSFHPFVRTAFSSNDMLGNTSRLERALFRKNRSDLEHDEIRHNPQDYTQYMEMWIPNHLARLNNVKGVYVPEKAFEQYIPSNSFKNHVPRSIPPKEVPKLTDWNHLDDMQNDMDQLIFKQKIKEDLDKVNSKKGSFLDWDDDIF